MVAGQSFGGLAAMFAALNWPQRFGWCAQPVRSTGGRTVMAAGRALSANSARQGEVSAAGLRVWLKRANANRSFYARTGGYCATHHNTADDFLASG